MSVDAISLEAQARALEWRLGGLPTETLLRQLITRQFRRRIALVSSFGAEAAVLLHLVARIDPATPVIFLDTGQLFAETLAYRDALVARFCLSDIRSVRPDPHALAAEDPEDMLWQSDPDACCALRKVRPLTQALAGFDAWINGRKRSHGGTRAELALFEAADGRIKVNPLADWDAARIDAYFDTYDLPRHPLVRFGYRSIGCMSCSDRSRPGEGARDGRWRGRGKSECGIHLPRDAG